LKLLKTLFLVLLCLQAFQFANGQSCRFAKSTSKDWSANPFKQFVFIENKGQLGFLLSGVVDKSKNEQIYFTSNVDGIVVYFSAAGIIYSHDELKVLKKLNEEEREKLAQKGNKQLEKMVKTQHLYLEVEWMNANPLTVIKADDVQTFYYTYPNDKSTIKAACYKKIIYKNIYPNIDVEYILPEKGGIKYTILLHPGADLSRVKMRYKNAKEIKSDGEGNIIIKSELGNFIDHAPVSFYATEKSLLVYPITTNPVS
jgi:hypothetical protein